MNVKIFGKGIDVGDSLRSFSVQEISKLTNKYIGENIDSVITISKTNKLFEVEIVLHVSRGFKVESNGSSGDSYRAVSVAVAKLESRIKKHKNRVIDKHRRESWVRNAAVATDYILERKFTDADDNDEEHLVIAEQEKFVLSLSVSEAVAKLDITEANAIMFKNAETDRINVVYRRNDGHIGWIDCKTQ